MKLTENDDSNELFFKVVDFVLICKSCRKLSKEDQFKCNHIQSGTHWLNDRKKKRLKRLYASDPAAGLRELVGLVTDDNDACFDHLDIVETFALEHIECVAAPKKIYVSVDPCGGGASRMAICSGYISETLEFVVKILFFFLLIFNQVYIFLLWLKQSYLLFLLCLLCCIQNLMSFLYIG